MLTILILGVTALTIDQELIGRVVNLLSDLLLHSTLEVAMAIMGEVNLNASLLLNGGSEPILGTSRFVVKILPSCSGYEGMVLMIALLAAYCYLQRNLLHLGRAILIIPLACLAMFILNSLRIVILIAIGHFYSPRLALDGFHIVGGWLNLLIVYTSCLLILSTSQYFLKISHRKVTKEVSYLPFLLPLAMLISVGLVDQILFPNFDWLYPLPILLSAIIIFRYRIFFMSKFEKASFGAYLIGVSIFFLWIFLIPVDSGKSLLFSNEINSAPLGIALIWLICRIIGAVLVVPIAEELAFRGFLLPYLNAWINRFLLKNTLFKFFSNQVAVVGTSLVLIISSLLFGILHSDFLAGSLAGIGFGVSYLLRRKLIDAIVAHAATNGLLAAYVIGLGYWSYW